jgi:hypothetical protein
MAKTDFDNFVERQQQLSAAAEQEAPFDPKKELEDWLHYLNVLYSDIQAYLKDYISGGSISSKIESKELNEDFSGPYIAPKMIIRIGLQEITLDPIGTMLIGMKGRVDVIGRAGTARLALMNKKITSASQLVSVTVVDPKNPQPPKKPVRQEIEWVWKIMSRPPALSFIELNKESFLEMLLEVSNG